MSPIKNTYKTMLLVELFKSNSMFMGVNLWSKDMTNAIAEHIANSKGYYWQKKTNSWVFKAATSQSVSDSTELYYAASATGKRALLIRLMADQEHLQQKTNDITLALEIAGYRIVKVSEPTINRAGSTWVRVYITVEREN